MQYFPPEDEEEEERRRDQGGRHRQAQRGQVLPDQPHPGEQRVIVSDVAGTTRDAVDSYFENEKGKYLFIDTAGMRKKSKVDDRLSRNFPSSGPPWPLSGPMCA